MFESSFSLLLFALFLNLSVPLFIGIPFLWLIFWNKFRGILLYVLAFFIGTGVISYSLFNIQFIHIWIGYAEYFSLLWLIIFGIFVRLWRKDFHMIDCLHSLRISWDMKDILSSFTHLSLGKKIFTFIGWFSVCAIWVLSFLFTAYFPSYSDDSFTNWHKPSINIYYDDGIKIFWPEEEILWRGRLWYPLFIPLYKALIADMFGVWNDIYANIWHYLSFFFFIIGISTITWLQSKNIFYTLLPSITIVGLPLVFFHISEGYLDLACALYSVWTLYFLLLFLQKKDIDFLLMAILFWSILSHLKNDGIVIYLLGIILAFVFLLSLEKKWGEIFSLLKINWQKTIFACIIILWCVVPFIGIKSYYDFWYNQAAGEVTWVGISSKVHWEIFWVFPHIFFSQDNYNIALIFITWMVIIWLKKNMKELRLIIFAWIFIFLLLLWVFLFTENYQWVMNQTTVNRVFTMLCVILFSFIGLFAHALHTQKKSEYKNI